MHLRAITIASHCLTPPEFILSSFCSVRLCQQNLAICMVSWRHARHVYFPSYAASPVQHISPPTKSSCFSL